VLTRAVKPRPVAPASRSYPHRGQTEAPDSHALHHPSLATVCIAVHPFSIWMIALEKQARRRRSTGPVSEMQADSSKDRGGGLGYRGVRAARLAAEVADAARSGLCGPCE
jgi:hypothetical protein